MAEENPTSSSEALGQEVEYEIHDKMFPNVFVVVSRLLISQGVINWYNPGVRYYRRREKYFRLIKLFSDNPVIRVKAIPIKGNHSRVWLDLKLYDDDGEPLTGLKTSTRVILVENVLSDLDESGDLSG